MDDYNKIAKDYNDYTNSSSIDFTLGYPNVAKYLSFNNEEIILDYGCGNGKFSKFLNEKANIIGVDRSKKMIEFAKKIYENENRIYKIIESGNLDFIKNESIDYAVLNFVTCSISTREEISKIIQEIDRVIKRNGILVLLNLNWDECNGKEFSTYSLNYYKNLQSGDEIKLSLNYEKPIEITDFYWSIKDYTQILNISKFEIDKIDKPKMILNSNGNEHNQYLFPFEILVCKKQGY